jgi:hypothetical protein
VYPNPSSNQFTVYGLQFAVVKQIALEFFSVEGKKVLSVIPTAENVTINTENFTKGIYLLKAGATTRKIVIE